MKLILKLLRLVYTRLTAGSSTQEQAVQSGIWAAGVNFGDRILQMAKIVILAQLLSPEAFGLLGIALLMMSALSRFSDLGFDQALIQHDDDDVDAYLNTAWFAKIVRGIVIALITLLLGPYIAVLFNEPQAGPLIQLIGLYPLVVGLQNPAVVYFQKSLNFHRDFIYQVGGRLVDLVVAVVLGLIYHNVWALAIGIIMMGITRMVISYSIHEYRPNLSFNFQQASEMFVFGKWLFVSSILYFLYVQGDDVFVGWFFAANTLGFYQIAYRFSNAPATEITQVISRVAFPALSKLQNDVNQLREGYLRVMQLSTVIAFPMAAGLIAVAPQFVHVAFGDRWKALIPLIQVLAVFGGQRALESTCSPVFKAVGRPDYNTKVQVIKTTIIVILLYPAAVRFGVVGVGYVMVGSLFIVQILLLYLISRITKASLTRLSQLILYPLGGSVIMLCIVAGVNKVILQSYGIIELTLLIFVGIVTYTVYIYVVEKLLDYNLAGIYENIATSI